MEHSDRILQIFADRGLTGYKVGKATGLSVYFLEKEAYIKDSVLFACFNCRLSGMLCRLPVGEDGGPGGASAAGGLIVGGKGYG